MPPAKTWIYKRFYNKKFKKTMQQTITHKPAKYWRQNKKWAKWLGKQGKVLVSTYIKIAGAEHQLIAPYSFAVIEFGDQRLELMGVGHERLKPGDRVECVLRKNPSTDKTGLIEYQLKAKKI